MNADNRFIIHADRIFQFSSQSKDVGQCNQWTKCTLSQTFRMTREMADFVNQCVLGENRIRSNKSNGHRPRYIMCDVFGHSHSKRQHASPYEEIIQYLSSGYQASDIFVLAPSVKSEGSPVRKLANKISNHGIPIFVPISDEEKLDQEVTQDKMIFSTFHQVKGLERKVVVVFNFDQSYFKYYKRTANPSVCSNELYVAITRASERLSLFHHYSNDYLLFLKLNQLSKYCQLIIDTKLNVSDKHDHDDQMQSQPVMATELIRHIPESVIQQCMSKLVITCISTGGNKINIPIKILQPSGYEMVCDITGTAIPAYFEYQLTGKMSIAKQLNGKIKSNPIHLLKSQPKQCLLDDDNHHKSNTVNHKHNNTQILKEIGIVDTPSIANLILNISGSRSDQITTSQLLKMANHWNAYVSGYNYKINQIVDYNWLSKKI